MVFDNISLPPDSPPVPSLFFVFLRSRSHSDSDNNADCSSALSVGHDALGRTLRHTLACREDVQRFTSFAVFAGVSFALCLYNSEAGSQSRQSDDSPDSPS